MLAVWAETELILADQFRDGNVPAMQKPLDVARLAFAALPETVTERYYRGDAACHEHELMAWLRDEQREDGPHGCIGFAISARMSQVLRQAVEAVPEAEWGPYGKPDPEVFRECAEVSFVPTEPYERKDLEPLFAGFIRQYFSPGLPGSIHSFRDCRLSGGCEYTPACLQPRHSARAVRECQEEGPWRMLLNWRVTFGLLSKQLWTNFAADTLRPELAFVPRHHVSTSGALGFLSAKGICW